YAETVIKTVMHSPLRLTDPHATTAYITTWHGYKFVRAAALAGVTLAMAHGAYAETVIKTVMHSPLRLTDPHATTAYITTWHGY
ncbi:hypothetical protein CTI14_66915, partial [Methylobacterium radiotolerans]